MNKSKFAPLSFKAINENEKYLPELNSGFPIPNELLQFMDCLVSTSKKENDAKGKIHSNLSEIGFKILLTMLALRNPFNKYPMTLENLEFYCKGYAKKSIREASKWLVKKGLVMRQKGKYDKDLFQVNYTGLSYSDIASDIYKQLENDVKKEDIVFKGIRELTTPEFKKADDGKHTDNFTMIPFFLPEAKRIEINGELDWKYVKNDYFDSLDGNTLKVILQLAYKQNYNSGMKTDPLTRIKINTLQTLCSVSRNKIIQALDYLQAEGFLRAYEGVNRRKCKGYIFNFKSYRLAKVRKEIMIRKVARFKNSIQESFPVSELHNSETLSVSELQNEIPFPSQNCYNKHLNLNKIKESFKKDVSSEQDSYSKTLEEILKDKERREELVSKEANYEKLKAENLSDYKAGRITEQEFTAWNTIIKNSVSEKQDPQKQIYEQIKKELLSDFRLGLIKDYRLLNSLQSHLDLKRKQREELYSKDELIKSFSQLQSRDNFLSPEEFLKVLEELNKEPVRA